MGNIKLLKLIKKHPLFCRIEILGEHAHGQWQRFWRADLERLFTVE
ncbi:hypothetical protein M2349_002403 [Caldanaerobacter subterraneus subsp. tengcongensis MB4]|nr:hypothetical protein [Caldanaerobacter subterraneus subsp. tengcongensis MB4]